MFRDELARTTVGGILSLLGGAALAQQAALEEIIVTATKRAEPVRELRVELDRHDARASLREREREGAAARADLQEDLARSGSDHAQELVDGPRAEEVLTELARHAGG